MPVLPPHDDRRNMYGIDMTGDPQSRRPPSQGLSASAARDASAARIVGDATAFERLCPRAVPTFPSPAVYMGRFTISGHWSWLVCGHESLEMRSYLGIGSEAVFCSVMFYTPNSRHTQTTPHKRRSPNIPEEDLPSTLISPSSARQPLTLADRRRRRGPEPPPPPAPAKDAPRPRYAGQRTE